MHFGKDGHVVDNTESEVATWKIAIEKNIYAKVVENTRINFSVSPYRNLLLFRKEKLKYFEIASAVVFRNDVVTSIMNLWGYHHWNTDKTTLDIYLLFVKQQWKYSNKM